MAWQAAAALPPTSKGTAVPPTDRGLLARLDALVALVADRHGLALLSDGRLAAAEARVTVRATGLALSGGSRIRASTGMQREAVELLRAVAEGVGLLRVRGDRLEATSLRHAWSKIDETLRAGLTFAAWCHRVPLAGVPTCRPGSRPWSLAADAAGSPARPARRVQVGLSSRSRARSRARLAFGNCLARGLAASTLR
jgi:hypothetical protein